MQKKVSIVIPCYQNEENIPELTMALKNLEQQLANEYILQVVVVDDGSTDATFNQLKRMQEQLTSVVKIVKLTGNFGSYNALLAGLNYADGDCYVQLHADLQDPPEHIPEMLKHWAGGFKLVIGQRVAREDNGLNGIFSGIYHWLIKKVALPFIPDGGFDLVLFDRQIRDHIVEMNETNTNLIYLVTWLRFAYVTVPVIRKKRLKGKSQWSFLNKAKLFIDSFVSFSYFPIRFVTICAVVMLSIWIVVSGLMLSGLVKLGLFNWMLLTVMSILFVNLAIVAEYLWRSMELARNRPRFVVDQIIEK